MNKNSVHNPLNYNFNPFGGLSDQEVPNVIITQIDLDALTSFIRSKEAFIIELVGKKGRGKTLHLKYLNLVLEDTSIFHLDEHATLEDIISNTADLILIDSIHHLNLMDRIKLFKRKKKIILTTHLSRSWEYTLANKAFKRFRFKGINSNLLKSILENRLRIASKNMEGDHPINPAKVEALIDTYKDDFRSILNHLYDEFQSSL